MMRLPWHQQPSATAASTETKDPNAEPTFTDKTAIDKETGAVSRREDMTALPENDERDEEKVVQYPAETSVRQNGTNSNGAAPVASPSGDNEKGEALEKTTTVSTTDPGPDAPEDDSKYPHGVPLYLLVFGLCLGTFVVALDNTIIATAIPHITSVFNSLDDVGWYGSAYLLTTAALQPSLGKVYTFFNVKLTYVIAVAVFELGSVLCGAATSSKMLIVGRAIAGCGAAGIFSGAMTIIAFSVPLRKRSIYIASISSMFGIASVVGPIIGGAFTDKVSWRWCFYINLPIGGLCIGVVFLFFKNPDRKESKLTTKAKILEMDLWGALFLIGAVICLLLALQWGGSTYPWSNSKVYGNFIGFGLLIGIFIYIQFKRGPRATLPPHILLYQRTVLATALFSFFLALGLYACIYFLPIYFQSVKGVTAEESGIRIIPFLLSNILAAIPIAGLVTVVGYYTPFIWVGAAIFPVGCGLLKLLTVDSTTGQWIGYQILAGAGSGICVQLPFIAVQCVLSQKDMPTGNAIAVFFNTMGGAIGVSIAQNVFSNGLVKQIPRHTTGVNVQTIIAAGATGIRQVSSPDQLRGVLVAYNIAVTDVFYIAVAAGCVGFLSTALFEMKSVKGKKLDAAGAAA